MVKYGEEDQGESAQSSADMQICSKIRYDVTSDSISYHLLHITVLFSSSVRVVEGVPTMC